MLDRIRTMAPKNRIFIGLTLAVVFLDQLTKILVVRNIEYARERIEVIPGFLALVHSQNPGAAIGLLGDQPVAIRMTIFGIFTVVAVAVLISMLWQLRPQDRFQSATLGLIMAGALGNGIDRLVKQQVTDFILVYASWEPLVRWLREHRIPNEYPTFNVADSAIVVGVGFFLLRYLFLDDSKEGADVAADIAPGDGSRETSQGG